MTWRRSAAGCQHGTRRLALLDPDAASESALARWRDRWAGWPRRLGRLDSVARRGVAYVLACWAIPVGNATCLTGGKLDCYDAQRPAHGARPRMGFCEPDDPV